MESLQGKVVCITGAASGIGAATARQFAKCKARLALHDRNRRQLEEVADECRRIGQLNEEDVFCVLGEMTKENDVRDIAKAVLKHFNTVHCLVNNAGYGIAKSAITVTLDEMDEMLALFVRSPLLLSQLFMPALLQNRGSIINVSSLSAHLPKPHTFPYNVAKGAMSHMTKSMAIDLIKHGVRVNAVSPGLIKTNILITSGYPKKIQDKVATASSGVCASTRPGEAEDVAHVIVFLASELAAYVTGQDWVIDGGDGLVNALLSHPLMAGKDWHEGRLPKTVSKL